MRGQGQANLGVGYGEVTLLAKAPPPRNEQTNIKQTRMMLRYLLGAISEL